MWENKMKQVDTIENFHPVVLRHPGVFHPVQTMGQYFDFVK